MIEDRRSRRGGARRGAGRPKGSKTRPKEPTLQQLVETKARLAAAAATLLDQLAAGTGDRRFGRAARALADRQDGASITRQEAVPVPSVR